MPIVLKSGILNFLEPSGPVQASNGIALLLPLPFLFNNRVVLYTVVSQVVQSVQRLATGWTVLGSNPGGGEIFRTCPDRPWDPPRLLYNGYRVFLEGKERLGRDADPSPSSSTVGHKRVKLYLYSPYGPYGLCRASVPVQG